MELDNKSRIAKRAAMELKDGSVVNLGVGVPTLVSNYIPDGMKIIMHAENGALGLGGKPGKGEVADPDVGDAGGANATLVPGASCYDSATSFGFIRGGHVDVTILGALQVDQYGNLANWTVPGKMVAGYGGAMDLITCAKRVIVAMEHTNKGQHKILEKCTLPLTGAKCVDLIITEMAVMEVTEDGLVLREISEGYTLEEVQNATGAKLIIPE